MLKSSVFLGSLVLLGLTVCGCLVVSLSPWFGPDDQVQEERLLGNWQTRKGDERVEITKADVSFWGQEVHGLRIQMFKCADGKAGAPMVAVSGRFGGKDYLMLATEPRRDLDPNLVAPLYLLLQVTFEEGSFKAAMFSEDSLEKLWARHRFGLGLRCFNDDGVRAPAASGEPCGKGTPMLIDETALLQEFLAANAADEDLFDPPETYLRLEKPECIDPALFEKIEKDKAAADEKKRKKKEKK
jgi:hypothetical protein